MSRTQLTENDLRPVPKFPPGEVSTDELNTLSEAVHALQRVVYVLYEENGALAEELAELKKKPATSRSTSKTAASK